MEATKDICKGTCKHHSPSRVREPICWSVVQHVAEPPMRVEEQDSRVWVGFREGLCVRLQGGVEVDGVLPNSGLVWRGEGRRFTILWRDGEENVRSSQAVLICVLLSWSRCMSEICPSKFIVCSASLRPRGRSYAPQQKTWTSSPSPKTRRSQLSAFALREPHG